MDLRNKANSVAGKNSGNDRVEYLSTDDLRRKYDELRTEHFELRRENERLRLSHRSLEKERDRYEDLYDYAPFGYICLDESGVIVSANLTVASMLDQERQTLIGKNLTRFINRENRQNFYNCRQTLLNTNRRQSCDLVLCRSDESGITVQMALLLVENPEESQKEIRVSVVDISEHAENNAEFQASYEKLMRLYRHIQLLREQEKYTFSRAIHDELSQVLAVLKMELCWLEEHFDPDNTPVRQQFDNLRKLLDHTIKASKDITSELRPYMLDELGLGSAVKWAAKEFKNRSGIETDLIFATEPFKLETNRATAAFRIVQELLDNVERHAGASKVTIRMHTDENNCLILEIIDDGRGISRTQMLSTGSFGLMGVRERCHEFGGDVIVTGKPDAGTRIKVWIPMAVDDPTAEGRFG